MKKHNLEEALEVIFSNDRQEREKLFVPYTEGIYNLIKKEYEEHNESVITRKDLESFYYNVLFKKLPTPKSRFVPHHEEVKNRIELQFKQYVEEEILKQRIATIKRKK